MSRYYLDWARRVLRRARRKVHAIHPALLCAQGVGTTTHGRDALWGPAQTVSAEGRHYVQPTDRRPAVPITIADRDTDAREWTLRAWPEHVEAVETAISHCCPEPVSVEWTPQEGLQLGTYRVRLDASDEDCLRRQEDLQHAAGPRSVGLEVMRRCLGARPTA